MPDERGEGKILEAKRDWVPVVSMIAGLVLHLIIVAYFYGQTTAGLLALKEDVQEWKTLFAPKPRVEALEGRVERIDIRVRDLEKGARP